MASHYHIIRRDKEWMFEFLEHRQMKLGRKCCLSRNAAKSPCLVLKEKPILTAKAPC